jgi:hypothetical protein
MENVRFTTPIQQLYNNPLHEGESHILRPTLVWRVVVQLLYWYSTRIKSRLLFSPPVMEMMHELQNNVHGRLHHGKKSISSVSRPTHECKSTLQKKLLLSIPCCPAHISFNSVLQFCFGNKRMCLLLAPHVQLPMFCFVRFSQLKARQHVRPPYSLELKLICTCTDRIVASQNWRTTCWVLKENVRVFLCCPGMERMSWRTCYSVLQFPCSHCAAKCASRGCSAGVALLAWTLVILEIISAVQVTCTAAPSIFLVANCQVWTVVHSKVPSHVHKKGK